MDLPTRAGTLARIHTWLMYTWCALVIPTVAGLWKSQAWLVFMAFAGFTLVMVSSHHTMKVVRAAFSGGHHHHGKVPQK